MQCLEKLYAPYTAIEQIPDSIGLLCRLRVLDFKDCKKLKFVPKSIWNLTSVEDLSLHIGETGKINLPDFVEDMKKLKGLRLSCNVRLSLPIVLRLSSLERLTLTDEGQILSSAKPFSLSKLTNLQALTIYNCTSLGSSLLQLPLNLKYLSLYNHTSLEELPDLSSLSKLQSLIIKGCISLQSISLLPSHLRSLLVQECTSLQDLPDMSTFKELVQLCLTQCNNLKSINLNPICLQVGQHYLPFIAYLANKEVAQWFTYQSSGRTVSFDIPPSIGLALWVVYTCKAKENCKYMRAVTTNDTEGITENYPIYVHSVVGEAQSTIQCITGKKLSMKSGDRIKVSFQSLLYPDYELQVPIREVKVKVKMCGVHVIQNRPSTSVY